MTQPTDTSREAVEGMIDALHSDAAIEAGDSDAVNRILKKIACEVRNVGEHAGWTHDASKAYARNSLDVAKALHDALLLGCGWTIVEDGRVRLWRDAKVLSDWNTSDTPDRAWLVAILKAYQAQLAEAKE